jgi:hypothetical protein
MATTARQYGKHPGGRPRTKTPVTWTKSQLAKIDAMAMDQCKDTTIADALGIDVDTFKAEFSSRTHKKRCLGKAELYRLQRGRAKKGSDTMLIWMGKQHLEQSDHQSMVITAMPPIEVKLHSPAPAAPEKPEGAGHDGR